MGSHKGSIIAGVILLVAGIAACVVSFVVLGFDPENQPTVRLKTDTYEVSGDFSDIEVSCSIEDVNFVKASDGICRVEISTHEQVAAEAKVDGNSLKIKTTTEEGWRGYIGIFNAEPQITVYLPKDSYASLVMNLSNGKVSIPNGFAFDSLQIGSTTGGVYCSADIKDSVDISTTTGDIALQGVTVTGNMTLNCNTGEVLLDSCDAATLRIGTNTGDVKGTLLSGKTFVTNTRTGDVDIPDSTEGGGRCEISTGTGDIEIEVR